MVRSSVIGIAAGVLALGIGGAAAQRASELSDSQIRQAIIQESITAYLATGHPCACPYNVARNGSNCGARSAYSRRAGQSPSAIPGMSATAWSLTGVDHRDRAGTAPLAASECYDGAQHIVSW
jgi:hypothetical protein